MAANEGYRRYIEAAAVLGQITRARAEEIVREMMSGSEVPRSQAQEWVDDLIERSRKATEGLLEMVRSEVANQMQAVGLDPDDLARQAADILRRSADAGRRAMKDASAAASGAAKGTKKKKAEKGKAAGKKAAAKAAKKAPSGKKAPAATKAAGKKAASPATKAAGTTKAAGDRP